MPILVPINLVDNRHVSTFYLPQGDVKIDLEVIKRVGIAARMITKKHPNRFHNTIPRVRSFYSRKQHPNIYCLVIENNNTLEIYPEIDLSKTDFNKFEVVTNNKLIKSVEVNDFNFDLLDEGVKKGFFNQVIDYRFILPDVKKPVLYKKSEPEEKIDADLAEQQEKLEDLSIALYPLALMLENLEKKIDTETEKCTIDNSAEWTEIKNKILPLKQQRKDVLEQGENLKTLQNHLTKRATCALQENQVTRKTNEANLYRVTADVVKALQLTALEDFVCMVKFCKGSGKDPSDNVQEFNTKYDKIATIDGSFKLCFQEDINKKSLEELELILNATFESCLSIQKNSHKNISEKMKNFFDGALDGLNTYSIKTSLQILEKQFSSFGKFIQGQSLDNPPHFGWAPRFLPKSIDELHDVSLLQEEVDVFKNHISKYETAAHTILVDTKNFETAVLKLEEVSATQRKDLQVFITTANNLDIAAGEALLVAEKYFSSSFKEINAAKAAADQLQIAPNIPDTEYERLTQEITVVRGLRKQLLEKNALISAVNSRDDAAKLGDEFKKANKNFKKACEQIKKTQTEISALAAININLLKETQVEAARIQEEKRKEEIRIQEENHQQELKKAQEEAARAKQAEEKQQAIKEAEFKAWLQERNDKIVVSSVKKYKILLSDLSFWQNSTCLLGSVETVKNRKKNISVPSEIAKLHLAAKEIDNSVTPQQARDFCKKIESILEPVKGLPSKKFGLFLIRDPKVENMYKLGRHLAFSVSINQPHQITDQQAETINPNWKNAPGIKKPIRTSISPHTLQNGWVQKTEQTSTTSTNSKLKRIPSF